MRENYKINKINSTLSIFGLVLLLLLSPCKVRNVIQAEFGIPQTKVLNKSQSTISKLNCQTFDLSETVPTISKPTLQQPDFLSPEVSRFDFIGNLPRYSFNLNTSRSQQVLGVPLYILYQNINIYS